MLIHLSLRFVYGHLFFCWRKNFFDSKCKLCTRAIRWEIDKKAGFKFERYFVYGWPDFKNDIFCSPKFYCKDLNNKFDQCPYFEAINKPGEVVEMFGTVAIRILLNICKRFLFCSEEHVKLTFYAYLADISGQIFSFACENIDTRFANIAFNNYLPHVDYNAASLKIVNEKYLQYLKSKEKV